jgi:hypothetical protein
MNVHAEIKDDKLVLTIDVSKATLDKPTVSGSEAARAAKEGRDPKATQIATTGGFTQFGAVKVSLNAMLA